MAEPCAKHGLRAGDAHSSINNQEHCKSGSLGSWLGNRSSSSRRRAKSWWPVGVPSTTMPRCSGHRSPRHTSSTSSAMPGGGGLSLAPIACVLPMLDAIPQWSVSFSLRLVVIPVPCSFHLHPRFASTPSGFRPAVVIPAKTEPPLPCLGCTRLASEALAPGNAETLEALTDPARRPPHLLRATAPEVLQFTPAEEVLLSTHQVGEA